MSRQLIEPLECRQLMSVTLDGGVLRIAGTAGNDVITVSQFPTHLLVSQNSAQRSFDLRRVKSVVVNARGGNDSVILNESVNLPSTINGGSGNDWLVGGRGNDLILGRAGDDTIHGLAGNDRLIGGAGSDRLSGDAGRDMLHGGAGPDFLDGGRGIDVIRSSDFDQITDY